MSWRAICSTVVIGGWVLANDVSRGCNTHWPLKHVHKIQGAACISSRASYSRVVEAVVSQAILPRLQKSLAAVRAIASRRLIKKQNRTRRMLRLEIPCSFRHDSQGPGESLHCARIPPRFTGESRVVLGASGLTSDFCKLSKKTVAPSRAIALHLHMVERSGTERTEWNATPTPERPERNANTQLNLVSCNEGPPLWLCWRFRLPQTPRKLRVSEMASKQRAQHL